MVYARLQVSHCLSDQEAIMNFFFKNAPAARDAATVAEPAPAVEPASLDKEVLYGDLITQRPALLDEKVKLHARIIDEFNLATLDKLSREELTREVRNYINTYARDERLSLNQRELQAFADEV